MLQSETVASRRPVKPVPFRQIKGVRVYQGTHRRTMVGNMAAICRMLELAEPSSKTLD
ncbi:hypothetical protein SGO26_09730 [Cupriavidus metallidurans]|jgi:hypothetical protein|uniref:hypothetical protein n=1 Tax=Cupriavidus TaxID=106589 RepID=UPI0002A3CFF1|nr:MULTISPECIES: hypothetical protein [Cupriavidus]EKZ96487.1 hypothetical protein D769_25141 [Cupriavidus sp. HMR-1]QWC87268.1 hypothetical protein KB891_09240 [Cupriavidus metallidurans]GMG90328.1 hypothetical protein Cmtc_15480 [Cupriavidus sp. TKC]